MLCSGNTKKKQDYCHPEDHDPMVGCLNKQIENTVNYYNVVVNRYLWLHRNGRAKSEQGSVRCYVEKKSIGEERCCIERKISAISPRYRRKKVGRQKLERVRGKQQREEEKTFQAEGITCKVLCVCLVMFWREIKKNCTDSKNTLYQYATGTKIEILTNGIR